MNKILICLEVPSISQTYEIFVPDDMMIKELVPLFVKAVRELSGSLYAASGHELLCSREQEILLNEKDSLFDYNIGSGSHLIML